MAEFVRRTNLSFSQDQRVIYITYGQLQLPGRNSGLLPHGFVHVYALMYMPIMLIMRCPIVPRFLCSIIGIDPSFCFADQRTIRTKYKLKRSSFLQEFYHEFCAVFIDLNTFYMILLVLICHNFLNRHGRFFKPNLVLGKK